jgi:hypothetical protein
MDGAFRLYGEMRNAHRIFVRKPEGKRPLGRLLHLRVGCIHLSLNCDIPHLAQGRDWLIITLMVEAVHTA